MVIWQWLLFFCDISQTMKMKWMKAKIKGKKWTIDRLKSAVILKTRPKHVFLVRKVPKPRGAIFCPPPFLPTFLREKKLFYARCADLAGGVSLTTGQVSSYTDAATWTSYLWLKNWWITQTANLAK
jgi:hypothetical protein